MNNFERILNGTNFRVKKGYSYGNYKQFSIIHKPSHSYVNIQNFKNSIHLSGGETLPNRRGKGIGTNLRALATLFAIISKKNIRQTGLNLENRSKLRHLTKGTPNIPTSTYILRERLGWKSHPKNTRNSVFKVGNNTSKVKSRLKMK